jgi:hypothetical protein
LIAAWALLVAMIRTLGARRAYFVYLACLVAPMFTNMTHGLHYHGYAFSLLLVQLAALLWVFRNLQRLGTRWMASFFLLGFFQGWLSFDYCFLVTFAAVPIALLVARGRERPRPRTVLLLVVLPGLGFVLAHGLHFLQSILYFGSIGEAIEEYAYRGRKTYFAGNYFKGRPEWFVILSGLRLYARAYVRWTGLFSPASIVLSEATLAAVVLSRTSFTVGRSLRLAASFAPGLWALAGVASAGMVSLLWLFAKPYHAVTHLSFVSRHLFLFYFSCCLFIVQATSLRVAWMGGARTGWLSRNRSTRPSREARVVAPSALNWG